MLECNSRSFRFAPLVEVTEPQEISNNSWKCLRQLQHRKQTQLRKFMTSINTPPLPSEKLPRPCHHIQNPHVSPRCSSPPSKLLISASEDLPKLVVGLGFRGQVQRGLVHAAVGNLWGRNKPGEMVAGNGLELSRQSGGGAVVVGKKDILCGNFFI